MKYSLKPTIFLELSAILQIILRVTLPNCLKLAAQWMSIYEVGRKYWFFIINNNSLVTYALCEKFKENY